MSLFYMYQFLLFSILYILKNLEIFRKNKIHISNQSEKI